MILLLLSLLAGALTVLAPCTISLLPVIVGGSIAGGSSTRRAITVTIALGVSVVLFTLLLKVSTAFITVPQSFWQIASGVIIIAIGLTMIFPSLYERLPFINRISRDSNKLLATGYQKQNFWGDVIVGASLGPVFTSCSPTFFLIVATVLPRSILAGLVYLLAYAVGLCVSLLVVALAGQKLLDKLGVASDPKGWVKRGIGVLFLIVGLFIALGLDAKIELAVANSGILNVAGIEKQFIQNAGSLSSAATTTEALHPTEVSTALAASTATSSDAASRIGAEALVYPKAPELVGLSGYINTDGKPISLASLKGKVVLIDFWDYTCINCKRETPYVEAWYKKYAAEGLVVVGVHTPEFSFEKLQSNVAAAVISEGITYPVVLDNDYKTWDAFANQFWPQVYLINSDGFIVYSHSGEGDYPETEKAIQKALATRAGIIGSTASIPAGTVAPSGVVKVDGSKLGSPETYFGYNRNQYLGNGTVGQDGTQNLTLPQSATVNKLYLGGVWNFNAEYAEATQAGASIEYQFQARDMYFVATSPSSAVLGIALDSVPLAVDELGADVGADSTMTIHENRLYHLVHLPSYGLHSIKIELKSGTLDAYTFTFG